MTQLLNVIEDWTCAIESGMSVDVIYLDFSKAFDRVPHACLISKLSSYGIDGLLLKWIKDFLDNRRHHIRVRGSYFITGPMSLVVFLRVVFWDSSCSLYNYVNDLSEVVTSS